jgi:hypothetical protein
MNDGSKAYNDRKGEQDVPTGGDEETLARLGKRPVLKASFSYTHLT